jgi:ubiquinone/menaquinone biosynthesis C-methylase UbiE
MSEPLPGPDDWLDVDESGLGSEAIAYLDATANALSAMRLRSHALLAPRAGDTVLDLGCGSGIALRELAELVGPSGTVVGVDPSAAMLAEARDRLSTATASVELTVGNAASTGQPDARFDGVRTERVMMHVADSAGAMVELARITKPGGRIVLVEPDHRRLAIDSDDEELAIRFNAVFGRALANGSAGLRARSDAVKAGLRVTTVEPTTYQFHSYEQFLPVFDLSVGRQFMLDDGVDSDRFDDWLAELVQRDAEGRFLVVGVMYLVVAEKA